MPRKAGPRHTTQPIALPDSLSRKACFVFLEFPGDWAMVRRSPTTQCSFGSVEYVMTKQLESLASFVNRCNARMGDNATLGISRNPQDLIGGQILCKRGGSALVTSGYPYMVGEEEIYEDFVLVVDDKRVAAAFGYTV
jgi:hypothetical protein